MNLHPTKFFKMSHKGMFKKCTNRAFTIVELVVVVAIFTIIMSVALWNQRALSNNILITNLGYEIALGIRETQAYGIGVRARPTATLAQDFQGGFGVYLSLTTPADREKMVIFNDINDNKLYDPATETFAIYQFRNQNGNKIQALCIDQPTNSPCIPGGSTSYKELTIIFKRPNPEANFRVDSPDGGGSVGVKGGPASIVISTPTGNNCRAVIVEATGQIRVDSYQGGTTACAVVN